MTISPSTALNQRKRALDALASMPAQALKERYERIRENAPPALAVRGPEIGAVMVRGRIGGGGAPFNLGEASVTRATVKLATGEIGHSIVLGRDPEKAKAVAHLDALRQVAEWEPVVERDCVTPAIEMLKADRRKLAEETAATRVDFFTLARGED
ncbi:phosphonate C-P lyase system protein PhnG [Mesorhizobium sp. RMAD-H1]|uniref:phosphonate C-P lyase system protein PhnG n=1 Tax=Mesorhizobium sp. RMAD-H1 TaxID=2587065 RepID=UPI00161F40DF|nr:phosphonate C-P lyase system protein PhnG [Mesorhizobium sp. RMAD-H1]MBB2971843.1 alpha-D-ribose 1-methylphosphonate 5-triphosphate synthase subunit PhnG [Mesorhizobium sp. RMAD-H1]